MTMSARTLQVVVENRKEALMNGVDLCEIRPRDTPSEGLALATSVACSAETDKLNRWYCRGSAAIDSLNHRESEHTIRGDLTR